MPVVHSALATRRVIYVGLLLAALAACRSAAPPVTAPAAAPPPQASTDGSYDWHVLLIAPMGSTLKDVPTALHEVLLFKDETRKTSAEEDAECYASDAPAPRFVGHTPDEFLLCFKRDRLARIQASVPLTTADAPNVFAQACAGWLKGAAPSTAAPSGEPPDAGACEGRDGAVRFSGHLRAPESAETPPAETTLVFTLDSVPPP